MSKTIRKLSPFALGMALCAYPVIYLQGAQAASLALGSTPSAVDGSTVDVSTPATASLPGDCLASALPSEKSSTIPTAVDTPASGVKVGYQSSPDLSPASGAPDTSILDSTDPNVIAQIEPGCELVGTPPQGGGALAAGSLLPLLAAAPLGAIPALLGDDDPPKTPLSESSTAGVVAGVGLLGLWFSRKLR
jgi:hypothetical protein